MKTSTLLWAVAVVVVLGGIAWAGITYPKVVSMLGSSAGATFGDAKIAAIVMTPTSASATSSSILNSDGSDRIIDSAFVSCYPAVNTVFAQTGAGLANWTWTAATSSGSAPPTLTNTNYALNVNVATSSTNDSYIATSTYTNIITRRWAAGSYLTFQPNGTTSITSANCTVGVYYHGS